MRTSKFKKFVALLMIVSIILPTAFFALPIKKVKAQASINVPVFDYVSATFNAVTSKSTAGLFGKENIFDSIAYIVAKTLIRQITTSIVNWINSGFDGNPSFVTNPEQFFLDVGDIAAGKFIEGSALDFLCSPFRLDIRLALGQPYLPFPEQIRCRLTDVFNNAKGSVEGFTNGDFSQGGWKGWLSVTNEPQGNAYGSYLLAKNQLELRVSGAKSISLAQLNWGSGFLSVKDCGAKEEEHYYAKQDAKNAAKGSEEAYYANNDLKEFEKNNCTIKSPGKVIEGQINQILPSGMRQLELADEFNEIINALVVQMMQQVFTATGLLGNSQSSSSGGPSITERLQNSQDQENIANVKNQINVQLDDQVRNETRFKAAKNQSLTLLAGGNTLLNQLTSCYAGKISQTTNAAQGNNPYNPYTQPMQYWQYQQAHQQQNAYNSQTYTVSLLTSAETEIAKQRMELASSTRNSHISIPSQAITSDIVTANLILEQITALKQSVSAASNINELQQSASAVSSFLNRPDIHRADSVISAENEQNQILGDISTLNQDTNAKVTECIDFPTRTSSY